ncbi:MAG: ribosome maturation factor RimM [Desulfobacter sp.]
MDRTTWFTIGKVTGVHGLGGNLKVWSFAESPESYQPGQRVRLRDEGAPEEDGKAYTIAKVSSWKKGILLALEGVTRREAAEEMVGKEILMNREQMPELEEETWYWQDLIGLAVTDRELGILGTVERIFPTGADDILVVTDKSNPEKTEVLIPLNGHFVSEVDLESGRLATDLPQGFILD